MTKELEQTHNVVRSADSAGLDGAIASVEWERRGLLQRLVRTRSAPDDDAAERKRGT
jgi:hypothetical protein